MSKLLIKFWMMAMLSGKLKAQCIAGCLRCIKSSASSTTRDKCLIVDTLQYYYLNSSVNKILKAKSEIQKSCSQISQSGNCLTCHQDYYLETSTQKCLQVTAKVDFCRSYSVSGCDFCQSGYYINLGKCEEVGKLENGNVDQNQKIANCINYRFSNNEFTCNQCSNGYYISDDRKTCMKFSSQQNCVSYTRFQCMKCDEGYTINKNLQMDQSLNTFSSITSDEAINFLSINLNGTISIKNQNVCEKINVSNCETLENANACLKCIEGYYLSSDKECIKNPDPVIQNCKVYSSISKCIECKDKHYLQQSDSCLPIKQIQSCEVYNGAKNKSECTQCETDFYLENEQSCKARSEIKKCKTYEINSDKCKECDDGYILSGEKQACGIQTENCQDYDVQFPKVDSTKEEKDAIKEGNYKVKCLKCLPFYKLNNLTFECESIQITNCQSETNGQCTQCSNTYILSNGQCEVQHETIENCKTYPQAQFPRKCEKCEEKFKEFKVNSKCNNYPEIKNCKIYENFDNVNRTVQCKECESGFVRTSRDQCSEIFSTDDKLIEHCDSVINDGINNNNVTDDAKKCNKCQEGYGLVDSDINTFTKICVKPVDILSKHCNTYQANVLDIFQSKCLSCKSGYYPLDVQGTQVCIPEKYQKSFNPNFTRINQCRRYNLNNQCKSCSDKFYIQTDSQGQTTCKNTCPYGLNSLVYSDISKFLALKSQCHPESQTENKYAIMAPIIDNQKTTTTFQFEYHPISCIEQVTIASDTFKIFKVFKEYSSASPDNSHNNKSDTANRKANSIADSISYSNVNPYQVEVSKWILNKFDQNPVVDCQLLQSTDTINGVVENDISGAFIQDCQFYLLEELTNSNNFQCLRCQDGKVPDKLKRVNGKDYITSCNQDTSSTFKNEYQGMPAYWKKFVSVTNCVQSAGEKKAVMVAYATQTNFENNFFFKEFQGFRFNIIEFYNVDELTTANNSLSNILCIPTVKEDLKEFFYQSTAPNEVEFKSMDNCGIVFFNQKKGSGTEQVKMNNTSWDKGIFDKTNQDLLCAACLPKYKAVSFTDNTPFVSSCTEISQCKISSTFNMCDECNENYYFEWDDTLKQIQFDKCIQGIESTDMKDCLSINSINQKCMVCKEGFTLNENGVCVQHQVHYCENKSWNKGLIEYPNFHNFFLNQQFQGCNERCIDNYIPQPYQVSLDKFICANNSWVTGKSQIFRTVSTDVFEAKFINQCLIYKNEIISNNFKCHECQQGFIISKDSSKCVSSPELTNCIITEDNQDGTMKCWQCRDTYGLKLSGQNKICQQNNIVNCEEVNSSYANESDIKSNILCKKCKDFYYLNSSKDKCLKGQVTNCKEYNNDVDTCVACKDGFWPVGIYNNVSIQNIKYCLPKKEEYNCKKIKFDNELEILECFECDLANQKYESLQINEVQQDCFPYSNIDNCKIYDTLFKLDQKSFKCIQCNEEYYLQNELCLRRTKNYSFCKVRNLIKDECVSCNEGYFLNENKTECLKQPDGIYGCVQYQSKTLCSGCDKKMYLEQNECKKVTEEIKHCEYYANNTTCQSCEAGKFLNNNICEDSSLKFCKKLQSTTSCEKCEDGYKPVKSGQNIQCSKLDIPNCKILLEDQGQCKECDDNFYVNDAGNREDCKQVTESINNCIVYKNNKECLRCEKGYYLNQNGNQEFLNCIETTNNQNPFCEDLQKTQTMVCSECAIGYKFQNGTCQKNRDLFSSANCFIADKTQCLVCQSKSYMNEKGECIIETNNDTPVIVDDTKFSLLGVFLWILVIL